MSSSKNNDKKDAKSAYRVADARFVAAGTSVKELPPSDLVEVAFAGKSNVGKSSLLNSLMERRALVRTSKTPGATRTINVFEAKLVSGETFAFTDLPGYGYAARAKSERASWGPMLEGYIETRASLRALVLLVDIRRGVGDDDRELADYVESVSERRVKAGNPPIALVLCATKVDKLSRAKRAPEVARLGRALSRGGHVAIGYSAVEHEGRDALWRRLMALRAAEQG